MPNPGKGGIGMVVEFPDSMEIENFEFSEGYIKSTNNRMELMACIRALEWIQSEMKSRTFTRVIIVTDSDYVYSNNKNAQYWKDNGWKNEIGKPYENHELWDTFLKERQKTKVRVDIVWEKGKTRAVLIRVDSLAKQGAKHPTKTDYGFQSGKFTAPRTANKKGATLYSPNSEDLLIRIYRKHVYGKNSNELWKITFDVYDEKTKQYVQKYFAYQGEGCITLKRNNCYRVQFNNDPKFPKIINAEPVKYLKDLKS